MFAVADVPEAGGPPARASAAYVITGMADDAVGVRMPRSSPRRMLAGS